MKNDNRYFKGYRDSSVKYESNWKKIEKWWNRLSAKTKERLENLFVGCSTMVFMCCLGITAILLMGLGK